MKILFLNYTEKDSEVVRKATNADVYRGCISDQHIGVDYGGKNNPLFYYYFPIAPYECSFVFVNLDNHKESEEEFKTKLKILGKTETKNLYDYWSRRETLLVLFSGETNTTDMLPLGVPLRLIESSGVDTETVICFKEEDLHYSLIREIEQQVSMPTTHYIETLGSNDKDVYYNLNSRVFINLRNKNRDILSASLSKTRDDYSGEDPGVIVFPKTKNLAKETTRIVEHFTAPENNDEWLDSDIFYPPEVIKQLTAEIDEIIVGAKKEVATRKSEMDKHRNQYSFLKDLVTTKDKKLVDAVHKVLSDVLGLKVTRSDELNQGNPKEDLLVVYDSTDILLEVKGTNRSYPSLKFPQQALQHAIRQRLADVSKTGLVLNHDFNTSIEDRKLAYNDKDTAPLIEDIHFIGTKELLKLAIDVIENRLTQKQGCEILFSSLGRALYPPNK